jgi:hypothetical protein
MRVAAAICALLIGASVGGCALIEAEKNNRGGFLDQVADDLWMKADSKKMRALRALAIEASVARIAMITPKSAPDRALLARRIGETSKRADLVRKCAFPKDPPLITGQRSGEPCFFFDSVMVDYENALFDLAIIALPIEEAKKLMTRVTGGIASVSLNPMELVQTLIDIGREAFRYGRVVGAIYRDTLELEVQVWLESPKFANAERARGVPEQFVVTEEKVAGLAAVYVRGNDNIPAWRAEIAVLRAEGLEPVPHERFVTELYSILVYICGQIVSKQDDSYNQCAFIPSGLPSGAGAGGRSSGSGAGAGETERRRVVVKPPDAKVAPPQEKPPEISVEGAKNAIERGLKAEEVQQFQALLCLPLDGKLLDPTRDGIRIFKTSLRLNGTPTEISSNTDLQNLVKFFGELGTCSTDRYLNFYERTTMLTEEDVKAFQRELNRVPDLPAIPESGRLDETTRKKIEVVRTKLTLQDPSAAVNRQITNTFLAGLRRPR